MALDPEQLAQLQRAYEILGVPSTASALQIKRAYRKLTRRWHPDLYTAGSQEQADATQMMKIIDEAYDQVATAPLRYYDPRKQTTQTREREPYVQQPQPVVIFPHDRHEPPQKFDLFGFSVRFIFGALFGVFAAFRTIVRFYHVTPRTAAIIAIAEILGFGLMAASLETDSGSGFLVGPGGSGRTPSGMTAHQPLSYSCEFANEWGLSSEWALTNRL